MKSVNRRVISGVAAMLLLSPSGAVLAYDGPVYRQLGIYGLAIGNEKDLAVRANHYVLTPDLVTAAITVENYGDAPVASQVLMQFQPVTHWHADSSGSFGSFDADPMGVAFFADGSSIKSEIHMSAIYRGIDITHDLKRAGLSLPPFSPDPAADGDAAVMTGLEERGVLRPGGRLWTLAWDLNATYSTRHVFEPGRQTRVEAQFKPLPGAFVETLMMLGDDLVIGLDGPPLEALCLTGSQEQRIRAVFAANKSDGPIWPYAITDYSVTMIEPARGFGGIPGLDFRIEPGKKGDIVSVCGGAFEEQSDGAMVWKTDRAEAQTLKIHFLAGDPEFIAQ